jgi:hypothetical protein
MRNLFKLVLGASALLIAFSVFYALVLSKVSNDTAVSDPVITPLESTNQQNELADCLLQAESLAEAEIEIAGQNNPFLRVTETDRIREKHREQCFLRYQ